MSLIATRATVTGGRRAGGHLCAVCGNQVDAGDIERTDGWRWFNDGRGGLVSLCSTCDVPEDSLASAPPGTSGPTKPGRPLRSTLPRAREIDYTGAHG
jgi:hypothetical protein